MEEVYKYKSINYKTVHKLLSLTTFSNNDNLNKKRYIKF